MSYKSYHENIEHSQQFDISYEALVRDAMRYRFLRDDNNWCDDGDAWSLLGEASGAAFDNLVDMQMYEVERATLQSKGISSAPSDKQ